MNDQPNDARPPRFRALVLTHDRNAAAAEHMMRAYDALWPSHPFVFRIPYQDRSLVAGGPRRERVPSPPGIAATIRTLLSGLPDDEWVYWCIDDKYPVGLRVERIARIATALRECAPKRVNGVLFCRVRGMLDPINLDGERAEVAGERLLGRANYRQIWIHQFVQAKVLRHLFACLPEAGVTPRELEAHKDSVRKPTDHGLFVTEENLATFGESMCSGVLTSNCVASMRTHGVPLPCWQPAVPAHEAFIGPHRPGAGP